MLKGIAASGGIQIGKVLLFNEQPLVIDEKQIPADRVPAEITEFEKAVEITAKQLEGIKDTVEKKLGRDKGAIFEAHIMILQDAVFLDEVKDTISSEYLTAEHALDRVIGKYITTFNNLEDEYLKERAADIKDIGIRLSKNILGVETFSVADISEEVVLIARDLTPSDTAQMNSDMVKAFATDVGGRTSHTAIMARTLEIPAVVGLAEISGKARNGDLAIVDGDKGVVYLNPDQKTLREYRKKQEEYDQDKRKLGELKDKPCETNCQSRRVEISANIGTPRDCKGALKNGAEGIGLYRTEFLYMDRADFPSEEEQFTAYKSVAETMAPYPVIIRTLDIGGDKKLPYLDMPEELNPFLGWRAIRLCLDRKEMFKTQLRAILRASSYGNLRIMYPMISGLSEIYRANGILGECKLELEQSGITFDRKIQVGIMVEIPSAAIIADILAQEVDFFSIGTNDLIQYTLAVDRMNEKIADLYEPFHPAVLRLLKQIIDSSHRAGIWTGMCGEMAGDPLAALLLLGLGLDEFSMSAVSIPKVKKVIRASSYEQAKSLAEKVLSLEDPAEIKKLLHNAIQPDSIGNLDFS